MPFWRRRYPRRRRYWRRRPGRTIFRRYWRTKRWRRRRRVRKRLKLPSIFIKQYQPPHIRKLCITGTIPLFACTSETISHNFAMYFYETAPTHYPTGGGFNIIRFNLQALYQLHQKALSFWTQSNDTMPLIKYSGARVKLYSSEHTDYIANYHTCLPMEATLDTYQSTHPTIMQLNNRHKIVRCRKNRPNKKPYTLFKIKPPSQLQKQWYFQKELATTPLFMIMVSGMSLDRYYMSSKALSTTIGFKSLNTKIFQFHDWKSTKTTPYQPKQGLYMYALENGPTNIANANVVDLIVLGQTKTIGPGVTIISTKSGSDDVKTTMTKYASNSTYWGNPFDPKYLTDKHTVYYSNKSIQELLIKYTTTPSTLTAQTKIGDGIMQTFTEDLVIDCRYNPYTDYSDNHVFLEPINNQQQIPWRQPTDHKLEAGPYPIWLSTWGFTDWQKNRLKQATQLDYVLVIISNHITPQIQTYIPIDDDFLHGRSPFGEKDSLPTINDQTHWQPKLRFQERTINIIACSGPGTLKLPPELSAEAHCSYKLYFKVGGCAPETKTIEDPNKQPTWTIPGNLSNQPSLQSPSLPIQSFIYNFDKRRDIITKRAAERLLSISPTKTTLYDFTEQNLFHQRPPQETSASDTEEEAEKETLLRLIQQQRHKQLKFKQRILQLMELLHSK
nr:MAG: ORF1 [TTV-like mini virus]